MNLFLSYNFADEQFVQRVSYHLRKQQTLTPYCYGDDRHIQNWVRTVGKHLADSEAFILFLGKTLGKIQKKELEVAIDESYPNRKSILVILPKITRLPKEYRLYRPIHTIRIQNLGEADARYCAQEISKALVGTWIPDDDLPIGYPFDYEKNIIEEYSKEALSGDLIALGCPREWPRVPKNESTKENPIDISEIGLYRDWDYKNAKRRDEDPQVVVAALTDFQTSGFITQKLTFPEAGPRKYLYYPCNDDGKLTVGIMVSGGIAPGINSVIAGIVERHFLYAEKGEYKKKLRVRGYQNGISALFRRTTNQYWLTPDEVNSQANLGGSMIGTSRASEFMTKNAAPMDQALERAVNRLSGQGTEILYIIGGDGSMRAAHSLWKKAQDMGEKLSVVAIPKTMDNDVLWVWQSFGFLSAVERSKEAIQQLHTEAKSNPRLCVIQLFGSDSGFVVTHAVTASGVCDLFLAPEVPFTMGTISEYITNRLLERYDKSQLESSYGVVVMAETAIPLDAEEYMEDPDIGLSRDEKQEIRSFLKTRRVFGQTPDALRSGGLKLVSRELQRSIRRLKGDYWRDFRVFTNEPRHLIRAIPPSSSDIVFGHRLGSLAVDCAMAGYTDFLISQWLTEYVMVPLRLVTLGRKRIPKDGIFYKAARASTGQPADLTLPLLQS